jgi:predicted amidohydrolase
MAADVPTVLRLAAVTGGLDWSLRSSCSGDAFDGERAAAYVASYTEQALARMKAAAAAGADIVVGPEYFRGSEMFTTSDADRRALCEPAAGATSAALGAIAAAHGTACCCAYDINHSGGPHQTGVLIAADGALRAVQPKHPRQVPAPADWPFDTAASTYDAGPATVGITVCSDCTYDPTLPLTMTTQGMQVLLLPGCGFAGDMWRSYVTVRARDTQCPVVYADDGRAAIADGTGRVVAETKSHTDMIIADVELRARRSSPDEPIS